MKAKWLFLALASASSLALATAGFAQAPSGAPSGATGLCKDGTYTQASSQRGACSRHGGVKEWYGKSGSNASTGAPRPGGGPGKVWVNTSTHVYHCQNDKYYGNTKHGTYMSESDAQAKGYRPSHGQKCS